MSPVPEVPPPSNPRAVDPDPFSAILLFLGAVGSIASIASWVEQRQDKSRQEQERGLARDARFDMLKDLIDLRSHLGELQGSIEKLNLYLRLREGTFVGDTPALMPPTLREARPEFGGLRLALDEFALKELSSLQQELATLTKRAVDKTFRILSELDRRRVWVSHETTTALLQLRGALNTALRTGNYAQMTEECQRIAALGTEAVNGLMRDVGG